MNIENDLSENREIESMLLSEMDPSGKIMVRSLDMIHARTGLSYETLSLMATILQRRSTCTCDHFSQ